MEKFKSLIHESRNYFIAFMVIAIAVVTYGAVTSRTVGSLKIKDTGNATVVEWNFTLDSLTALQSPAFNLAPGAYDFASQQYTIYKKTVSTYGTPIVDVYLQDCGFAQTAGVQTDTMTVDTLCSQSVTEADTMGISKPLFSTSGNQMAMGMMVIYARALNADVNTGKIRIVFPKRGR